ncbi:hypothetical protein HMPREF9093_01446, partial [Fusobacterium sp. oral taxon 370 str. F0437]
MVGREKQEGFCLFCDFFILIRRDDMFDVVVIGAGIMGAAVSRELS